MKNIRRFSILCLVFLLAAFVGLPASHAQTAKQLQVGSAGPILNTGDDTARTVDLPITLKGGFNDVNGLAVTLIYDKAVFDFIGLVQQTARIEDGTNDVPSPPAPATIASTIYYQANNKSSEGRVLIAAAGANFFSATTADVIPFKARFRVKLGMGLGSYPIGVQQTIIGPDTASSAGYTTYTPIPVATGLAPTAAPTTAQSFAVQLLAGSISVSGGYSIGGTVKFADNADANGAIVRLRKKVGTEFILNEEKTVTGGQYSFTGKSAGDYKVIVLASRPGYQDRYESGVITVAGNVTHNVTLLAYSPTAGTVKVNNVVVTGVKVKVMLDTTVIGTFPVDANGYFVTTPLDPTKTYTFYAVYGNATSDAFNPATPYNWTLDVGSISGTISGLANGQNVMVHVVSSTAMLERMKSYTGTGAPVDYAFANLLPKTDYIVSVVGDGIPVTYYDGVTDIGSASPQTVVAGAPTSGVDFTFAASTVAITGQITEGGTGVANVPVFSLETTTMAFQSTYSGTGGTYTLNLAAGNYLVFAYKESSQKTFYYRSELSGGTTQNDYEADEVTPAASGIDISLDEDTCMISGRVSYRTSGGDPVAGIMVRAEGSSGSAVDVTDEDGNYDLTGLHCTGEYDVTIFPNSPYPPQTESATAAESTTLDFVIQTGWVVSGTVEVQGTSAPIRGAWVYLLNSSGMVQGVPSVSNAAGEYLLADVPSGVYTLVAEHGDYQTVKETELVVEYDVSAHTITMVPGGSISGTVTISGGGALGGVLVIATRAGEDSRYATTNSSGQYEVKGLVNGNAYYVMFSKSGYVRQLAGPVTATQAGYDRALVAHAAPVSFTGTVKRTGGTGIANAYVVIQSSSPKYSAATWTGSDGAFSFTNVVAGANYRLVVLPGGGLPIYVEESVNLSSSVSGYTITITASTITGTVTLSDSATGKSVIVYLLDSATGTWAADVDAVSAGGGSYTFTFDGVGAGNFKVCAFSLGYSLGWYGGADFAGATAVTAGATLVDFTLTAN